MQIFSTRYISVKFYFNRVTSKITYLYLGIDVTLAHSHHFPPKKKPSYIAALCVIFKRMLDFLNTNIASAFCRMEILPPHILPPMVVP